MYETIMTELNEHLGQGTVMRDETRLYVNAETLFEPNKWELTEAGRELAGELGKAFMKILKSSISIADMESGVRILNLEVIGHTDNRGKESGNDCFPHNAPVFLWIICYRNCLKKVVIHTFLLQIFQHVQVFAYSRYGHFTNR